MLHIHKDFSQVWGGEIKTLIYLLVKESQVQMNAAPKEQLSRKMKIVLEVQNWSPKWNQHNYCVSLLDLFKHVYNVNVKDPKIK